MLTETGRLESLTAEQETEEDSGQARSRLSDRKINGIIKKIRLNAQTYLGPHDGKDYE